MEESLLTALRWLVLVVAVAGCFASLLPPLPDLVVIWVAALVYGVVNGFTWAGGAVFALITLIFLFGLVSDSLLMGAGARQSGASWAAIGLALLGAVAGTVLLPPLGGVLGALLVLFAVEFYRLRNWRAALQSLGGMALGCGWSVALRFAMGMVMVMLYVLWAFVLS